MLRKILILLICGLPLAAVLTGCSDLFTDNVVDCGPADMATSSSYIKLSLSQASSSGTRATPLGGELGDGTEKGQDYENTVNSAALFLYAGDENTRVNTTEESTPVTMVVFNSFEQTTDERPYDNIAVSAAQSVSLDNGTYRVIAIANPKDLTWARDKGSELTLGDVRDHIEKEAWTETTATGGTKTYSSFLMTSENDEKGSLITLEDNPQDDPATTFVEVERMAARVDYQATGTFTINEDEDGNVTGDGDSNYTGAKVEITGAAIVNNLTAGSYELKRVSTGLEGTVTYLGSETADETTSIATNYVIDPWTDEKTGGSSVTIDGETKEVKDLYGVYYPGYATDGDEQNPSYWAGLVKAGTQVTVDGEDWNIVGYTMENTTYADYTSKAYSSAIVFGAKFTPATETVRNSFYEDYEFNYGTSTFFRWNNILYATAEDMMAVAYPNVFTTENMFGEETFTSITDLEGLAEFAATLRDDDPTGYKAYLQGIVDEGEFPTSSLSDLYWETYMENECGYKFDTTNGVTINAFDVETTYTSTRAALNTLTDGAVSTYEDSQCYYTWWIRHSNDDTEEHDGNETNGIMEYAIVRNNIYKLQVTSVYSIGGDIPQEGLRIYVYVKDWTMLDEEVIDL